MESEFSATVLRCEMMGDQLRLRQEFRARDITDEALLTRLCSVCTELKQTDPTIDVADLITSYMKLNGRCCVCLLPTTLDTLTLDTPKGAIECPDWKLYATPHDALPNPPTPAPTAATQPQHLNGAQSQQSQQSPVDGAQDAQRARRCYQVAHFLCAKKRQSHGLGGASDLGTQIDTYAQEMTWLGSIESKLDIASIPTTNEKDVKGGGGDEGLDPVHEMFGEMQSLYGEFRSIVQEANAPPHCYSSRWVDDAKTILMKRCHKTTCCGEWNPADTMTPRRLFKPGQIDSNDYLGCSCPYQHKDRPPSASLSPVAPAPSPATVSAGAAPTAIAGAVAAAPVGGAEGGKLGEALRRAGEISVAQRDVEAGFPLVRRGVASETYLQHKRLMCLHAASDSKLLFPSPPPAGSEEVQWRKQRGHCCVCLSPMEVYDSIQWDLWRNAWFWMHGRCNPNKWAEHMSRHVLSVEQQHRCLYRLRHDTNRWHQRIVDALPRCSLKTQVLIKRELIEPLRARVCNIAEQALVQLRFCESSDLKTRLAQNLERLRQTDEDAALHVDLAFAADAFPPKPTGSKKKRPTTKKSGGRNDGVATATATAGAGSADEVAPDNMFWIKRARYKRFNAKK